MIVLKRSMNPGFAGIENELYYDPKTAMLFGDAKSVGRRDHAELGALGRRVWAGARSPAGACDRLPGDRRIPGQDAGTGRPGPLPSRLRGDDGWQQALAALADETFDVVVVGGGITGAGVALDAAARGYSVALVEKADFASGTSSRSSKLVHGGLRYLQNFDLGLVREALLERQLMVKLAPHLVRPLPLVVPAFEGQRPDRLVGVGLNLYDVMARRQAAPRRRGKDGGADEDEGIATGARSATAIIPGDEVVELLPGARRRASRPPATSSTTARPTTRGSC